MSKISLLGVGVFCTSLLFVGVHSTPTVQAATISDADVSEQNIAVQLALVNALEEHLKLLQMIFIQRLEAQVAALQAQL